MRTAKSPIPLPPCPYCGTAISLSAHPADPALWRLVHSCPAPAGAVAYLWLPEARVRELWDNHLRRARPPPRRRSVKS